jgi:hypothetical protein
MTLFEKICRMVGSRRIPSFKLPAFKLLKMPSFKPFRVGFASKHVTTIVVMAIMVSAAAVSVGLYFAIKDVASSTYNWPEPAQYEVTSTGLQTMGHKNPDYEDGTESQTLSIRLADGARISTLRIKNVSLGKAGIARAFDISPITISVTGATAYLWVGNLTITDSSFPTFKMETSQVANLTAGIYADGHTMSATLTNTIPDVVLQSERLSSSYIVDGSIVDRIQIYITGNSGAFIDNLILENVDSWVGEMYLSRMRIGTMTMNNSNQIGDGSGIDSSSAIWEATVEARDVTNTIQDRPIKVQ